MPYSKEAWAKAKARSKRKLKALKRIEKSKSNQRKVLHSAFETNRRKH